MRANGLQLLLELSKTYKPTNVPEVIGAKTVEFWGHMKRLPNESIDDYYDRFHELLEDLQDADEPIPTKNAIRQFIFTLGPEFESIQHNYRVKVLPAEWFAEDWPTILTLCHDYYNSVKPRGIIHKETTGDSSAERIVYQKKIRDWWSNPTKFGHLIEAEQAKYPGKCLYHLIKSHQSSSCAVKTECDRLLASTQSLAQTNVSKSGVNTTGHLHHITDASDDGAEEQVEDLGVDFLPDDVVNDTNDESLQYFSRVSNHYLRLVPNVSSSISRHDRQFPIIADSGANCHMFRDKAFFKSLQPASGNVILGDGKTSLPIQGIGTILLQFDQHVVSVPNVRYVPDLVESIYSLFSRIKCPGHELHSSFEDG